jgi:hypothetical protein
MKELEHKENYIQELQKKIKELETPQTHPSEPEVVLDPTGASTMDVRTTTPEWVTLEEELPAEEILANLEEELLANLEEELLASELPDFNSMEDFTQWLDCENCLN